MFGIDDALAEVVTSSTQPALGAIRLAWWREALERLTERDQTVLLLWNAGLSYAEIAEQTGLARGAISTTLARALKRLTDANSALEGEHAARG